MTEVVAPNEAFDARIAMSPEESDVELEELDDREQSFQFQWGVSLLKHLLIMIVGGAIFAIPVLVLVLNGDVDFWRALSNKAPQNPEDPKYAVVSFFTWCTSMIVIMTLISYITSILPRMIIKITEVITFSKVEQVKQYLEFYVALLTTIQVLISVTVAFVLWCVSFPNTKTFRFKDTAEGPVVIISRIFFCIFLSTVIISIEKIILHLIAVRFHRTAYRQRLEDADYGTFVLDRLNKARKTIGANRKSKHVESNFRSSFIQPKRSESFSPTNPLPTPKRTSIDENYINIYENINKRIFEGRYEEDIDLNSLNEARRLAKKIFASIPRQQRELILEDFYPIFATKAEATKAFEFFDRDGNGDISRREMRDKIVMIYKERKDLTLALRDTSQAVGKLDNILMCMFIIAIAFSWALVFGQDLYATLVPFGTLFLGLSFIFGESAKELFQSIIFLFVMHPYDAGDRVYIDKDNLLVTKVGLLGTKFTHVNGQVTYITHVILLKKVIYNIRRSSSQAEQIDFQIDFDTPKEKIVSLKERLNKYLIEEESREFHGDVLLALSDIVESSKLNMFIWLEHKGNWQDGGRRWARKTRFMIALREICHELGMTYTLLPQKVEHINLPPYPQYENHSASTSY